MIEAVSHLMPDEGRRALTSEERADVDDVLDAAAEWAAGKLPWSYAAKAGTLVCGTRPSSSYTRFVALTLTPTSDPRRAHLLALIDQLLSAQGLHLTDGGVFSRRDLNDISDAETVMRRTAA